MDNCQTEKINRLKKLNSNYIKEHINNDIDWHLWGEKAFEKAINEDKLIFLSIGYSSCIKCHKMNCESFSNKEISKILNENYISIIVDGEERPDVEKVYMLFSEGLIEKRALPLNIILTPNRIPVFAGNYMSPFGNGKAIGLFDMLRSYQDSWENQRGDLVKKSQLFLLEFEKNYNTNKKDKIYKDILKETKKYIESKYDWKNGGFYDKPKFLYTYYTFFLMKDFLENQDYNSLEIVKDNLDRMYKGAVYDHIGGGFFRYSEDETWNRPHLEKNLFENSNMMLIYAYGYNIFKDDIYKKIAEDIYEFLEKELLSEEGLYYNSINGEYRNIIDERYFIRDVELNEVLGEEKGKLYKKLYNIDSQKKILPNLNNTNIDELKKYPIREMKNLLLEFRNNKEEKIIDKKIILSYNAILAGYLGFIGSIFKEKKYIDKSEEILDFIEKNMTYNGELIPLYYDGVAYGQDILLDYSYYLFGLVNIYISTDNKKYLDRIYTVLSILKEKFWSEEENTFFLNDIKYNDLVVNLIDNVDEYSPSSIGILSYCFIKLYQITGEIKYYNVYRNLINSYSGNIIENPIDYIITMISMQYM